MEELSQCGKSSTSLGCHLVWNGNNLSTTGAGLTGFYSPFTENMWGCGVYKVLVQANHVEE